MERKAEIIRKTAETDIRLALDLDGSGKSSIDSGVGFLDHMLTLFAKHGRFDLEVSCKGDTQVDDHHSVEDIGICLGTAFDRALGEKKGICRYGQSLLPMDETLILSAVDLSGRSLLNYGLEIPAQKVGTFDTELGEEFFLGFVRNAYCADVRKEQPSYPGRNVQKRGQSPAGSGKNRSGKQKRSTLDERNIINHDGDCGLRRGKSVLS